MAPAQLERLKGSKFTSQRVREGWTHFHVVGLRRVGDGWAVELAASCDSARRLIVPAKELKDRTEWAPGWTPLSAR
ncbi:MAG: TIGR02450 family Trp-rich protein [Archangiaceae bacterium]|nr:TIGR02450 family Trp-rich protein [Archangiaceae bacterium]